MLKNTTNFALDGYGSGETDFMTRLQQSPAEVQEEFNQLIIQPILAVLASTDQTAALTIDGHSDRVDTPDLTREQRRVQELDASIDRANSAVTATLQIVASNFPDGFPSSWADVAQVGGSSGGAGAAALLHSDASLTEDQRRENRRVVFNLLCFLP